MNRKFFLIGAAALVLAMVFTACADPNTAPVNPPGNVPHDIIVDADLLDNTSPLGYIAVSPGPGTKVMRNTQVLVHTYPAEDKAVDYVRLNGGNPASVEGNVYTFLMPDADATITAAFKNSTVTTKYKVYDGGFLNNGSLQGETEWTAEFTDIPDEEIVPEEDGEGYKEDGSAIKLALRKVNNYFGLRITFDPINFVANDVNGLSLHARTTYKGYGYPTDRQSWINEVVYGKYTTDPGNNAGEWEYPVRYAGETNTGVKLTQNWQEIIVPLPEQINENCDTIMLYFKANQVENPDFDPDDQARNLVFYFDQIKFVNAAEKEMLSVTLPASGSIPYSKSGGGPVLETALDILTMDTKIVYKIDGTRNVTMFGKDGDVNVTQFRNKFTDFYNPTYNISGGAAKTGAGDKICPNSANQSITDANVPKLTATYDTKTSNEMIVEVLPLPRLPVDGEPLVDFLHMTYENSYGGLVQLPLYWGGTAGDAQGWPYGEDDAPSPDLIDVWYIRCYIANISLPPATLSDGSKQDTWYVFGHLGLNHDLSGLANIVVRARLNTDIVFNFTLSSGFPGVESTLNPEGEKLSHSVPFVGKGNDYQDYVIPLAQFALADGDNDAVDLTCITGFEFSTTAGLNTSDEAKAGWAGASQPIMQVLSVKTTN